MAYAPPAITDAPVVRTGNEWAASNRQVTVIRPARRGVVRALAEVARLRQYGDLFVTLTAHRLKVRYKQSALGAAWAVLQPVSMMVIFTAVFSRLAAIPTGGVPYAVFAYTALLPWTFFSSTVLTSTNALVGHAQLVTKVYFPREILPLTYLAAAVADLAIASTVLAGLLVWYDVPVTATALYALPILAVLIAFAAAIALLFSAIQVRWRDLGVALPLLLQLWMFASPVVYPLDLVPAHLRTLYALNPLAGVIENFRRVVVLGRAPDGESLALAAAIALSALPLAYVLFKRVEADMADVI